MKVATAVRASRKPRMAQRRPHRRCPRRLRWHQARSFTPTLPTTESITTGVFHLHHSHPKRLAGGFSLTAPGWERVPRFEHGRGQGQRPRVSLMGTDISQRVPLGQGAQPTQKQHSHTAMMSSISHGSSPQSPLTRRTFARCQKEAKIAQWAILISRTETLSLG